MVRMTTEISVLYEMQPQEKQIPAKASLVTQILALEAMVAAAPSVSTILEDLLRSQQQQQTQLQQTERHQPDCHQLPDQRPEEKDGE
ncbi:hypothetical protein EC973_003872 [Apophysomyces ossiformis]|uniref:Uncharacterized protein n=1 Tax=Apophysomyces ossiformis TaxID=679940 RepID=A0A8H7EQB1_9FUNG|nr:hypothetical protein EC973_003872 [Apophysomyces ossiformis]